MGLSKEELEAKLAELEDNEDNKDERAQLQKDLDELLKDDKDSSGSGSEDDKKGPGWIPKFRYDSAASRARKAEEERDEALRKLQEMEGKGSGQDTGHQGASGSAGQSVDEWLGEADAKYAELLGDGKHREAAELMAQIRRVERSAITQYFQEQVTAVGDQATEAAALDRYISQVENDIPSLNPDDKSFDEGLSNTVLEVYEGLAAKGDRTPVECMARALEIVIREEAEEQSKEVEDRAKAGLRRNADAARRQAPDTGDHGFDSDKTGAKGGKIDPRLLTDDEFDALPESKKKEMRGDYV